MVNNQITKEEIKKLMEIPGKASKQTLIVDLEYVKYKKGKEGVELLKKKIEEWGNPIDYEKVKLTEWYPIGLRALSLLALKETFGWGDKEIIDLGFSSHKVSFLYKAILKYAVSIKKVCEIFPKAIKKFFTIGTAECFEINEKEKYLILHLKDFKVHPVMCTLWKGCFLGSFSFVIKGKNITIEETKCMFKGNPYHEYVIRWE